MPNLCFKSDITKSLKSLKLKKPGLEAGNKTILYFKTQVDPAIKLQTGSQNH